MSNVTDFLKKAAADDSAIREIEGILDGKTFQEASDGQLEKLSSVAKRMGFAVSAEELRKETAPYEELSDDELAAAAGGASGKDVLPDYWGKRPFPRNSRGTRELEGENQ